MYQLGHWKENKRALVGSEVVCGQKVELNYL